MATKQKGVAKYMIGNTVLTAEDILYFFIKNGRITATEIAVSEGEMKKGKVNKVHKHKIWQGENNGRWYTFLPNPNKPKGRETVSAMKEEVLYDKLYNFYFSSYTLETLFEKYEEYSKNETSRDEKTETEDRNVWNRRLKGNPIVKKDIRSLKTKDFIKFFDNMLKDDPTKKQVDAVRTLINHIYGQAVMEDIEILNPLTLLTEYFKSKDYRQPEQVAGYSENERATLLQHLFAIKEPDIYDKAIMLMFMFTVRIGELKGLKWADINDSYTTIYVQRQLNKQGKEKDVKRKSKRGKRYLHISDEAKGILNSIEVQGEYILMKDNKPLLTDSFNARLKKRTAECGVRYLSSHKIRFSNCTVLLKTMNIRDVQYAMGHVDQRMTEYYNRPIEDEAVNPTISVILTQGIHSVTTT